MRLRASPLVRMAQPARRPSRWWSAWLVVMLIIVAVPPLGLAVGNAVLGAPAPASPAYAYVGAFGSLATLLALWLWVRVKEGRALATVGFLPGRDWVRMLVGFGIGAGLISVGVALGLAVGVYGLGESSHTDTGAHALLLLLPLVLLFVLHAVAQVAVGSGYLLQISVLRLPAWLAIIGTSFLVAVLQTLNPVSLLNLFLFGIFAALVALHQGSLWLVAGVQAGWSCFQAGVFGLPVGGIPAPTALFAIGPVPGSPALVSGGHFGLGSGLLGTGVLVVATVIACLSLRRTTAVAPDTSPTAESPATPPRKEPSHVNHGI